jgi:hypothetical protein
MARVVYLLLKQMWMRLLSWRSIRARNARHHKHTSMPIGLRNYRRSTGVASCRQFNVTLLDASCSEDVQSSIAPEHRDIKSKVIKWSA